MTASLLVSSLWLSLAPAAVPAASLAAAPISHTHPVAEPAFAGYWLRADDAVVEFAPQGKGYVGRYVAFRKDPASAKKKAALNTVCFKDLKADGNELSGKVIDLDSGKEYNAVLTLKSATALELRVKVMGMTVHTETLTRQAAAR